MIQVSIVILNYNTFQLTCNCIASIIEYTKDVSYEIVLVDNQSTECDADLFLQKFPSINLIKSPVNGGFAKGNNIGIEVAKGEFILLLNSDTYLNEDSISNTIKYYNQEQLSGLIGCKMIYPNENIQQTARKFRSITWELLDVFRFIPFMLPYKKRATLMLGKYFKSDFSLKCDWLNGAFFMFPKSALQLMPNKKLDERFFMYGEDHLWCWQFKQLGYNSYFYCDSKVVHINNGSTAKAKQLALRRTILQNEFIIMKERKGVGLYYFIFKLIYGSKENFRIFVKSITASQ
jgi:GT2 family glycosyltransferase